MQDEAQLEEAGLPEPQNSHEIAHGHARTRARQGAFLAAYEQLCHIAKAAAAAGIAIRTHYDWMEKDEQYRRLFNEAKPLARQTLYDEAVDRAINGWDEPVFHNGQVCGHLRKRSDRLLERLLEANFPEFRRQHVEVTGKDGVPLIPVEAIAELMARANGEPSKSS